MLQSIQVPTGSLDVRSPFGQDLLYVASRPMARSLIHEVRCTDLSFRLVVHTVPTNVPPADPDRCRGRGGALQELHVPLPRNRGSPHRPAPADACSEACIARRRTGGSGVLRTAPIDVACRPFNGVAQLPRDRGYSRSAWFSGFERRTRKRPKEPRSVASAACASTCDVTFVPWPLRARPTVGCADRAA
jgi:hypothetical protein